MAIAQPHPSEVIVLRGLLCLLWLLCAGPASARVLVIGVDGASWGAIDPLLETGELPHLQALIELGGAADLVTVEPLTSPVVWTSIATGRSPAVHGVSDFFATRTRIAVPTIYERLAAQGRRVGLYEVLMTWPPPSLPGGFAVPGWLRRDETTWPPDARIFRTVYNAKPSNRDYLEQALDEAARKAASWKALSDRFDPKVGALTFYAIDARAHPARAVAASEMPGLPPIGDNAAESGGGSGAEDPGLVEKLRALGYIE